MLAPVIFISLRSPPLPAAEHSWWVQTKTSPGLNQYFFYIFLHGIFFPLNFSKPEPDTLHRFSTAPAGSGPKILWAPTL
ncbi:hypothetical protein [Pseudomonas sp. LD120]|uniref:hypothetical protein n=1 Tax=Pseudomonas sp. LD120 TaxID=485751 RepID=UPI001357E5C6|nr:hypothetical protein [Pseudomonas sp. LD120]KAF0864628.1 hypothetical protein PLD_29025 [Pseudomonas sp. LD120]